MTSGLVRRPLDLDTLTLHRGGPLVGEPDAPGDMCLMEAAAWIAGEPWSDHPTCVCPVLAVVGRVLNDALPDDRRQELRQYLLPMLGTAGDGHAEARRLMCVDWLARWAVPLLLDAKVRSVRRGGGGVLAWFVRRFVLRHRRRVGRVLAEQAAALRALPPITDRGAWAAAGAVLCRVESELDRVWLIHAWAVGAVADAYMGAVYTDMALWRVFVVNAFSSSDELHSGAVELFARLIHPTPTAAA